MIGLCFGGGQIGLGITGTAIGFIVLWALKILELRVPLERSAILEVVTKSEGLAGDEIRTRLHRAGFSIDKYDETHMNIDHRRHMRCDLRWRTLPHDVDVPPAVAELTRDGGVLQLHWKP